MLGLALDEFSLSESICSDSEAFPKSVDWKSTGDALKGGPVSPKDSSNQRFLGFHLHLSRDFAHPSEGSPIQLHLCGTPERISGSGAGRLRNTPRVKNQGPCQTVGSQVHKQVLGTSKGYKDPGSSPTGLIAEG